MNRFIPYLKEAKALPQFKLNVLFEDGTEGVVDLSSWVGKGVFKYWNDENNFSNFIVTADKKIEWNEMLDMDPDAFYLKIVGKTFEEYAYH